MQLLTLHITGPDRNEKLEVKLEPTQIFTIGRKECNLNLDDQKVSRRHVSLSVETGELVADDLGSHNGTYLRSEKISTQSLVPGDVLQLGSHEIKIVSLDAELQMQFVSNAASESIPEPEAARPSKSRTQTTPQPQVSPTPEPKVQPQAPASSPGAPSSSAPDGESILLEPQFLFYQDRKVNWHNIKETYLLAVKDWKGFWTNLEYNIPFERSLPVLAVTAGLFGLIGALHSRGMTGLMAALTIAASNIGFTIIFCAVLASLRKWLEMKGDFEQYLVFAVYVDFLFFPIGLVSSVAGRGLYFLAGTVFFLWMCFGFIKKFDPNPLRFVGLIAGVTVTLLSSLGILGYLAYSFFKTSN